MDLNDVRIAVTVVSLVLFLALMVHTWSRRRAAEHADAALLPFMGDDAAPALGSQGASKASLEGV